MRKKTLPDQSVVLRPRVRTKGKPTGDAVASAILTMMKDGWFQEEKRCSVVFDKENADHAAALAILGGYSPAIRAEILRSAIAFAHARESHSQAGHEGIGNVEAEHDLKPRGEGAGATVYRRDEKNVKSVKVDPALKGLKGLL